MADYRAGNVPDQNCIVDNSGQTTYRGNYQGIVKLLEGPQWTARESNMGLLKIYQFEARTGEPIRDLKGGACSLHLESGSYGFPILPSPLNFACRSCQCACSPCPPSPCSPCPPCPRPVESCLPGLHQQYRDFYPDCKESHLPSGYRNFVEHDDLYLPPSRPLSSASNYCNRPTSSRSWSPPSPSPQVKCHCGTAQYEARSGPSWDMPESKPCFQTFFQASSPSPRGWSTTTRHLSRCESLSLVEMPQQRSPPRHPRSRRDSRSISPAQRRSGAKDLINTSCQCSPRIRDTDKSFQTQKSGASSPLSPYNPELSPHLSPRRKPPSPYSQPSPPSSYCYYPSQPMGFPEPSAARPHTSYAAELVTVEKHAQCNCHVQFDQSYTRRSGGNSSASIRRVLRPESPLDLARSSRPLECTCQQYKPAQKRHNELLHYPTQNGSRSQSPESSLSTARHGGNEEADLNITTFLTEVKRILTSDVPPRLSPTIRKQDSTQDLTQDYYSSMRSTLKSEFPLREQLSSTGIRSKDRKTMLSSGTTDRQEQHNLLPSTEFFARVRSTLKPAMPEIDFSSRKRDSSAARDSFLFSGRTPDWEQEFPSSGRTTDRKQQDWEIGRIPRADIRKQAESWELSSCKQGLEFPSNGRRKQWEFSSNLDWEFPRATDRKQEYSMCVRTTERGSSPIIVTPKESAPKESARGARIEPSAGGRPQTAQIGTNPMNGEAPRNPRNGHHCDATERSSTRTTPQSDISPPPESDEDYRYGPVQTIPKAAEPKRTFNKRDAPSRMPLSQEVIRRCCCGMCKSTYSRSHFTTKCPFCANVHSCCCGMCSCPFPSCTSKSPILDFNTSNYTSTTNSPSNELPFHNSQYPRFASQRPKSVSPMRRTYLAGLEMPDKHRQQRSKSAKSRRPKAFEPSPRALLESFHNYLKSESRRAKTRWSPHRRCSDRRSSTHWNPPSMSPNRNCSQQTKRLSTRKAPQQAPWGTHPILLSPRPPNAYRLPYSGSHRGCCCSRCVNGKL